MRDRLEEVKCEKSYRRPWLDPPRDSHDLHYPWDSRRSGKFLREGSSAPRQQKKFPIQGGQKIFTFLPHFPANSFYTIIFRLLSMLSILPLPVKQPRFLTGARKQSSECSRGIIFCCFCSLTWLWAKGLSTWKQILSTLANGKICGCALESHQTTETSAASENFLHLVCFSSWYDVQLMELSAWPLVHCRHILAYCGSILA